MYGGRRLEAAACCTAAFPLKAGGVVCVCWALRLMCGASVPRHRFAHLRAVSLWRAFPACDFLRLLMISSPSFCTADADVLALLDLCFHIVRFPDAGGFGVVLLAPGHFQIDGGWVGQWVSCRGVS